MYSSFGITFEGSGYVAKDVFVKVFEKIIPVKLFPFKLIERIQSMIKYNEGIHEDEQILMYAGKELKDNDELEVYHTIVDGSTLDLVMCPSYNASLFFKVSDEETISITVQSQ